MDVPDKYKQLQKEWKLKEQFWCFLHYGLGILAAALAVIAGMKSPPSFINIGASTLSFLSAFVAAVLTLLSPSSRRKAYTEACDLLRVMRMRFQTQRDISPAALNDAVEKAQSIVARR